MIFHSIIPLETVFQDMPKDEGQRYTEMDYLGEKIQVSALTNNQLVIQRIISTSPKAYLNPRLQPGTTIPAGQEKGEANR